MPRPNLFYDRMKEVPPFDPGRRYTERQLDELATKLLYDEKIRLEELGIPDDGPMWLHTAQLQRRRFTEVYNEHGVPDPGKYSGLFHRAYRSSKKSNRERDSERHEH